MRDGGLAAKTGRPRHDVTGAITRPAGMDGRTEPSGAGRREGRPAAQRLLKSSERTP
jgi:hypothetical protein